MSVITKSNPSNLTLTKLMQDCPGRLEKVFSHYLTNTPALALKTTMSYCLENGGKRLRPLLIYATGQAFNALPENLDIPAGAVELIHTYSLIHDDLPCMDNADLRRGKPTAHQVYGDGMAVLAGDALHTLAMQIIATHPGSLSIQRRLHMVKVLSTACGPYGMAAGQAMDLTAMNDPSISGDLLMEIYRLKTSKLFAACLELGRLASPDDDEINQRALQQFGDTIGLAFQIQDDVLDMEATTESLGKPQNHDEKNHKITYPKVYGLESAKVKVNALYLEALEAIDYLGNQAQLLRELMQQMLERKG